MTFSRFEIAPGSRHVITVKQGDRKVETTNSSPGTNQAELITITLTDTGTLALASQACYAPPPVRFPLAFGSGGSAEGALMDYFCFHTGTRGKARDLEIQRRARKLLRENEPAVRRAALGNISRRAESQGVVQEDFDAKQVRSRKHLSPYNREVRRHAADQRLGAIHRPCTAAAARPKELE